MLPSQVCRARSCPGRLLGSRRRRDSLVAPTREKHLRTLRDNSPRTHRDSSDPRTLGDNNNNNNNRPPKRGKKRRHRDKPDTKVLALGQPRDAGLSLRALARAELANALLDKNDLDAAFSSFFAAAHDGLGAAIALSDSPRAAKLRDADPHRFDHLLNLVCRNDAFAAIQALTSALAPNPPQTSHAN
mmetsp:Transcript_8271/g.25630  ORF Transcript_8271/g.25630 Transcript_8271/m.25630 type:complete len:187 (-) Transcript_8271:122-682(-)